MQRRRQLYACFLLYNFSAIGNVESVLYHKLCLNLKTTSPKARKPN